MSLRLGADATRTPAKTPEFAPHLTKTPEFAPRTPKELTLGEFPPEGGLLVAVSTPL